MAVIQNDSCRVLLVPEQGDAPALSGLPVVFYTAGQTVAQAVYLSGLFLPPALCSGLARCGRCRMRLMPSENARLPDPTEADRACFTSDELDAGMRLTCRVFPTPGLVAELPPGTRLLAEPDAVQQTAAHHKARKDAPGRCGPQPTAGGGARLAIDLGTTSLQWRLLAPGTASACNRPEILWEGGMINPQMGAGSDVVSRIAVSLRSGGRERLRDITLKTLQALCAESEARLPGHAGGPGCLCLAGNTAMTAITLGLDTSGLAAAPYSIPYTGGGFENLPGLPPVWIPPALSPFVGGDISAGYAFLALGPEPPRHPFLLADMGTNGEFLLVLSPDKALAASVALGPALEGIGLRHGTEARPGAVTDFSASPAGLMPGLLPGMAEGMSPDLSPPGGAGAGRNTVGITGSGYLALLDVLLRFGGMDRDGHFIPGKRLFPLERTQNGEERLLLPGKLALYASDVEEALKVKAAFSMGLRRLLETAGIGPGALARVYLAGALGLHAKTGALENLGFFPPGMLGRITVTGNTSLAGAALLACRAQSRDALVAWSARVEPLDLAGDPAFAGGFASRMRFVW